MNPAQQLAAMRKVETKPCVVCGEDFTALVRAKYCSNRCKQAAKSARIKDARNSMEIKP